MGQLTTRVVWMSDAAVLDALRRGWEGMGSPSDATFLGVLNGQHINCPMHEFGNNAAIASAHEAREGICSTLRATYPSDASAYVSFDRAEDGCRLTLHSSESANAARNASVLLALRSPFGRIESSSVLAESYSRELGQLHDEQRAEVRQLQELTQRLIEQNVARRAEMDAELAAERSRLHDEVAQREARLAERTREDEARVAAYSDAKNAELHARELALDEKQKTLDDRTNTHVRRQLREELKAQLKARSESFALSAKTNEKRTPVIVGFAVLGAVLLGVLVAELFERRYAAVAYTQTEAIAWAIRIALTTVGLSGAVIYFIRWNDQWLQRHAAEEFRQSRMALDVDRASWIVEMALEWNEEKGTQIPPELVERLSRSLFLEDGRRDVARHPAHDAGSALLRAAASAKIPIPGGGEFTINGRGLRKLAGEMSVESGDEDA